MLLVQAAEDQDIGRPGAAPSRSAGPAMPGPSQFGVGVPDPLHQLGHLVGLFGRLAAADGETGRALMRARRARRQPDRRSPLRASDGSQVSRDIQPGQAR